MRLSGFVKKLGFVLYMNMMKKTWIEESLIIYQELWTIVKYDTSFLKTNLLKFELLEKVSAFLCSLYWSKFEHFLSIDLIPLIMKQVSVKIE